MTIGTRSVLFGAHCWPIHTIMIAIGWWKLYGFPWDPRLWVAFAVHDLGYIGKPNMDGPEGEEHPRLGARIMHDLFDRQYPPWEVTWKWHDFSLYHSRFFSTKYGANPSRLCFADKMAWILEPWWLYLPRVWVTGELAEYRGTGRDKMPTASAREWLNNARAKTLVWVEKNRHVADEPKFMEIVNVRY